MPIDDVDTVTAPHLDLTAIRRTLEAELQRREGILHELAPRATPNLDPGAYMTSVSTRRVMDQILAALDRIAAGTYGRCVRCGGAIVAGRLEVLPYAETCIDCQTHVEGS
jgi:DnaK suppressor protein